MTHAGLQCTASAIVALAFALAPASTAAAEMKWKVFSYVTKTDVKPVGDVEGHVAGTWERRGLCLYANDEIGVYLATGTLDATKGKGTARGSTTCTFEDGSAYTTTWSVNLEPGPKGLAVYRDGKGEYTAGTGRFQGIRGTMSFSGKAYTPSKDETKGDVVMDARGDYTLEKLSAAGG